MAIEWIERKSALVTPPGAELYHFSHFEIDSDTESLPAWRKLLNEDELTWDSTRLLSMKHPWAFIVGAMTNLIDPSLGHLPDSYVQTINRIKTICKKEGIGAYECFSRQGYGARAIRAEDATERDGYAIRTSDLLIILAGSSISNNTPREIHYATQLGKPLVVLNDIGLNESEYINWIKRRVINSPISAPSAIVNFEDEDVMMRDLRAVLLRFLPLATPIITSKIVPVS